MKNRKSIVMSIAILIAVVGLAIGYAATSKNLTITGTATANTTTADLNVVFDGTNNASTNATATAADNAITGTCTVTLQNVGDSETCTFEFKNKSDAGINASITDSNLVVYSDSSFTTTWSNSSSQYFTVAQTAGWSGTKTLAPNDTETFTITVSLKKANIGASAVTENFYVKLDNIAPVQG